MPRCPAEALPSPLSRTWRGRCPRSDAHRALTVACSRSRSRWVLQPTTACMTIARSRSRSGWVLQPAAAHPICLVPSLPCCSLIIGVPSPCPCPCPHCPPLPAGEGGAEPEPRQAPLRPVPRGPGVRGGAQQGPGRRGALEAVRAGQATPKPENLKPWTLDPRP